MDIDGRDGDRVHADAPRDIAFAAGSSGGARARRVVKRLFDVVVSGLALVLTMPILLAAALAIKLDASGPVIARHARVGKDGVPFELFKLRCTVDEEHLRSGLDPLDERPDPPFEHVAGPRLTRVGRFLRRTSIDELPQLVNVLRGEMSVVGPRPALPSESDLVSPDGLPPRLRVLPGVTGAWRESDSSKAS